MILPRIGARRSTFRLKCFSTDNVSSVSNNNGNGSNSNSTSIGNNANSTSSAIERSSNTHWDISNTKELQTSPAPTEQQEKTNKTLLFNVSNYPLHIPEQMNRSDMESRIAKNISLADFTKTGKVRCYNCGIMGHLSIDCSKPQVMKACYFCGNPGHMARQWYLFAFILFYFC